jgi:glutamate-5-semialdehyde dehydrogenase
VNSAAGVATIVSETTAAPSQVTASEYIEGLGLRARNAARKLASATTEQKNQALVAAAAALRERMDKLIAANRIDVQNALAADQPDAFIDRLTLDPVRIDAIAAALEDIAALPDPVGRVLMETIRPNGLEIRRVATPLGVIGMIYESRPNVGADAGALCLKSGNAVILRGGSDSLHSTRVIVAAMAEGLTVAGLPVDCIQLVDTTDREAVAALLRCVEYVDLVIPRGGKGLVRLVREQAQVPTLLHLDGNCHSYVHGSADIEKAVAVMRNAKLRRTGICGATESLVVDAAVAAEFIRALGRRDA